jgi:hypothetical protein
VKVNDKVVLLHDTMVDVPKKLASRTVKAGTVGEITAVLPAVLPRFPACFQVKFKGIGGRHMFNEEELLVLRSNHG